MHSTWSSQVSPGPSTQPSCGSQTSSPSQNNPFAAEGVVRCVDAFASRVITRVHRALDLIVRSPDRGHPGTQAPDHKLPRRRKTARCCSWRRSGVFTHSSLTSSQESSVHSIWSLQSGSGPSTQPRAGSQTSSPSQNNPLLQRTSFGVLTHSSFTSSQTSSVHSIWSSQASPGPSTQPSCGIADLHAITEQPIAAIGVVRCVHALAAHVIARIHRGIRPDRRNRDREPSTQPNAGSHKPLHRHRRAHYRSRHRPGVCTHTSFTSSHESTVHST